MAYSPTHAHSYMHSNEHEHLFPTTLRLHKNCNNHSKLRHAYPSPPLPPPRLQRPSTTNLLILTQRQQLKHKRRRSLCEQSFELHIVRLFCTDTHTRTHAHTHMHTHTRTHAHTHTRTHAHTHTRTHAHTHTRTQHTHDYTNTHKHTHAHTDVRVSAQHTHTQSTHNTYTQRTHNAPHAHRHTGVVTVCLTCVFAVIIPNFGLFLSLMGSLTNSSLMVRVCVYVCTQQPRRCAVVVVVVVVCSSSWCCGGRWCFGVGGW